MPPTASSLPNVRGAMQEQEVLFAQRLAANEKPIRDKALNKLQAFLLAKSSKGPGFTDDDALRLWKGLFYCMYMADKPLVQEEVAEDISYLLHNLNNVTDRYTFIRAAFQTFAREWNGIDIFRMNKFMMFMRRVLRQVFVHLKLHHWNLKDVAKCVSILEEFIIRPDDHTNATPLGIKLHLCTIILQELAKIGGEEVEPDVIMAVIQPYFKVLATSKLPIYQEAVKKDIIYYLMRQSDAGIDYEEAFEKVQSGTWEFEEEVMEKEGDDIAEEDDEKLQSGTSELEEGAPENEGDAVAEENNDEGMQEITLDAAVLDPRAGGVNVCLPQLQPDFNQIAKTLQGLGSLKKVSKSSRELLYSLASECMDLAGGMYPSELPEEEEEEEENLDEVKNKAVEDLKVFYQDMDKMSLKEVKKNLSEMEDFRSNPLDKYSIKMVALNQKKSKRSKKLRKKRNKELKLLKNKEKKVLTTKEKKNISKQNCSAQVNRIKAVDSLLSQVTKTAKLPLVGVKPTPQNTLKEGKKKKSQKKPKKVLEVSTIAPSQDEMRGEKRKNTPASEVSRKKIKPSVEREEAKSSPKKVGATPKIASKEDKVVVNGHTPHKVDNQPKSEVNGTSGPIKEATSETPTQIRESVVTPRKIFEGTKKQEEDTPNKWKVTPIQKKKDKQTPTKAKREELTMNLSEKQQSLWTNPVKQNEIEVFLKERRHMKPEKKKKSYGTPKVPPKTSRTIKINLKQNKEHDLKDYADSIRNSPQIPYSADKVPKAPVLKPTSSPILVGRPALKILKNVIRKSPAVSTTASPNLRSKGTPNLRSKSPKNKNTKRFKAADFF